MKVLKLLGIVVGSLLALVLLLTAANTALTAVDRARHPAPGTIVRVKGRAMHVLAAGQGARTVVILPGGGTPSPAADFAPLVKALQADFRVVVVEPFGYGWSDRAPDARTNANIVGEIRQGLEEAGFAPPYIVVPHSISGLYTLWWAARHPREISAVVGLEATVPALAAYRGSGAGFGWMNLARVVGVVRLVLLFDPGIVGFTEAGFTDADRALVRRVVTWGWINGTVIGEARQGQANELALRDAVFPASIPVTFVLSQDSIAMAGRAFPGFDWLKSHRDLVPGNPSGRIVIVSGGHYVHWLHAQEIAGLVREVAGFAERGGS